MKPTMKATGRRQRKNPSASVTINLRASLRQRDVIDRAAASVGKTRTDFMLESAWRAAEDVLLDRTFFVLEPAEFEAFVAALDAPPAPNERLRAVLAERAPWDR